ncbi:MAG: alpha/beta hydrolase [Clostridia bacterium]
MDLFWLIVRIVIKIAEALLILSIFIAVCLFRMAICRKTFIPFKKKARKEETPSMKAYREGSEWLAASPYEKHVVSSYDGLQLTGHFLPAFPADPGQAPACIVLCMHGYRSDSFKEYGIYANFYHTSLHADLMLPDQRAHGESEGKYICYGVKERFDVLRWLDYINRLSKERYGKLLPIYLHGISMGCATVLMAYGLGYPDNVRGIIADCGYTSPDAIFRHILKHSFHLPRFPVLNISNLISRICAGFGFQEASTLDAMAKAAPDSIPILFLHGDSDRFVPTEMSVQNYEACTGKKKLLIVKGAAHAVSYYTDKAAYEAAVRELILSPQAF